MAQKPVKVQLKQTLQRINFKPQKHERLALGLGAAALASVLTVMLFVPSKPATAVKAKAEIVQPKPATPAKPPKKVKNN